ncbi:hypothetical protein M436DRAFT_80694 [Aureobasidium namibiae CBS 147.97]|uniref:Hydrophobin n=1 Tax=Aureobasidium namibiae CBS 147.97 TaxID=1043004 RepID=A0A074WM79_9PEZI
MKFYTTLVGFSMAFGTLTMAAPARPPPPSGELINTTTVQGIKDCMTLDCLCTGPYCASTVDLDPRENATTNASTNDMINAINVAALDAEAKVEKQSIKAKKAKKGKKWDLCILFFNPLADCG